jgi:hypothetical protein
MQPSTLVKTYKGNQKSATQAFEQDARKLAEQGYVPTSQTWAPGSYGCGSFILALLLCVVLIGILVFIYMLIVKPAGTLTVTYVLQSPSTNAAPAAPAGDEKTCPKCAERVKAAAQVCRFCGHEFS